MFSAGCTRSFPLRFQPHGEQVGRDRQTSIDSPSLPWRFRRVTRVHVRSRATHFLLQIGLFERSEMRRETSRVSFLMCPFCVRGLLSVLTTENVGVDATDHDNGSAVELEDPDVVRLVTAMNVWRFCVRCVRGSVKPERRNRTRDARARMRGRGCVTTLRHQRGQHARLPALGRRVTRRRSCGRCCAGDSRPSFG